MSMIIDKLPYYVEIKGKRYKINVDYRVMLKFQMIMQDMSIEDSEKLLKSLKMFYPAFFEIIKSKDEINEATQKLIWFYKCGRSQENHGKNKKSGKSKRPTFSYELDDQYIYSAFLQDYGVDLTKDRIHWWKFKAMELGLKDDTQYEKIKSYRSYDGKDKDMLDLKKYWQLPYDKKLIEEADAIAKQLMKKG